MVAVAVSAYVVGPSVSGASGAAAALEAIPGSHAITTIEAKRAQLIAMTTAAKTLTVVAKPKLATPADVAASDPGASTAAGTSGGSVYEPPPDPGTAKSTAYAMLASFGFEPATQWGCLDKIWERESGWSYIAENPSGAFGIPQALPGSKMASAGPDWRTNPATQIRWGLGYIKSIYGTPCGAWNFELANGYY